MNFIRGKINGYNLQATVSDLLEKWSSILYILHVIYDLDGSVRTNEEHSYHYIDLFICHSFEYLNVRIRNILS